MKIVLISGKKNSGKDYVAEKLKLYLNMYNKTCLITHYADSLKDVICKTFDINRIMLDNLKNNNSLITISYNDFHKTLSFRELLQRFGTEAVQNVFGTDFWVKQVLKQISKSNCDYVIIPDFRFEHEYINNAYTIFVYGGRMDDKHISENSLKHFNYDFYIHNESQDSSLDSEILKILEILLNS